MRILVVEDEIKLAAYVCQGLRENNYIVDVAHNGIDALHLASCGDYQLILLDVMLPGLNGLGVLTAIRKIKSTPILMLTARDKVEDKVRGLEDGADDYLVKPFAFSELLARVQALLRRGIDNAPIEATSLHLADLEIDFLKRRVSRAGVQLHLTTKEFSLLAVLLRRQGRVLAKTTLAEQVWDMNFDSDTNVVEVAVRRLRAKLDDPFPVKLLHTIRGMGYVLELRDTAAPLK
ncbi:MAG: heavy metal response regulator transcription factor [Gammaproteobacteria bacterium]|nr:heavy metal response regulator transcription factor [Gammaproteobacteria bacterium]MBU0786572.1 heavy metal response regulator transcription factor [Gammaproteobacteria bacterium]MBU0817180.1 heavy metal response regulator transcription factor [Gammaproteobacteria bacterium]MBU1787700.1 heavy metal response regulator transcription factor [Gammaproteobacteria bacterium]